MEVWRGWRAFFFLKCNRDFPSIFRHTNCILIKWSGSRWKSTHLKRPSSLKIPEWKESGPLWPTQHPALIQFFFFFFLNHEILRASWLPGPLGIAPRTEVLTLPSSSLWQWVTSSFCFRHSDTSCCSLGPWQTPWEAKSARCDGSPHSLLMLCRWSHYAVLACNFPINCSHALA